MGKAPNSEGHYWAQGRIFISEDMLSYAVFDEITKTYLQAYQISFGDVSWIHINKYGPSGTFRLLKIQTYGTTINSFTYRRVFDSDGNRIKQEVASKIILAKIEKYESH